MGRSRKCTEYGTLRRCPRISVPGEAYSLHRLFLLDLGLSESFICYSIDVNFEPISLIAPAYTELYFLRYMMRS